MIADEALACAKEVAQKEGWPFLEPVTVTFKKRWFNRGGVWTIFTHSNIMGSNVEVVLDDRTGAILSKKYLFIPR